jgi:hypothetical protein
MIASRSLIQQHVPGDAKARSRWASLYASSQKFYYVRFRLLGAALPDETQNIVANASTVGNKTGDGRAETPLIVDANPHDYGKTVAFTPKAIMIAGGALRRALLNNGAVFATGWVGEDALEAMNIKASDGVSVEELQQKVYAALRIKYAAGYPDTTYPSLSDGIYIVTLYPFDSEVIFQLGGDRYRQQFSVNTTTRELDLVGAPVKVEQEYVDVDGCSGLMPFANSSKMPYIPLGVRVNYAMTMPGLFGVSYGAQNSEIRNPTFSEAFLNVDKVVATYLANIKNGYHSPILPPAAPIPGVRMMFATELRARGVKSPADFFAWAGSNKYTSSLTLSATAGTDGPSDADDYAYVGDKNDKSTWKLPIHNKTHTRAAMSNFDRTEMPDKHKKVVAQKIVDRATTQGVDASDFAKAQGLTINTDLTARGPGSGPRKGGGKGNYASSRQSDVVSAFKNHGYTENAERGGAGDKNAVHLTLLHNDMVENKGNAATVFGNGAFRHSDNNGNYTTGTGAQQATTTASAAAWQKFKSDQPDKAAEFLKSRQGALTMVGGGPGSGPRKGGGKGTDISKYASPRQQNVVGVFKNHGYTELSKRGTSDDKNAVRLGTSSGKGHNFTSSVAVVLGDGRFRHYDTKTGELKGNGMEHATATASAVAWRRFKNEQPAKAAEFLKGRQLPALPTGADVAKGLADSGVFLSSGPGSDPRKGRYAADTSFKKRLLGRSRRTK